jgi:hypothetical protein
MHIITSRWFSLNWFSHLQIKDYKNSRHIRLKFTQKSILKYILISIAQCKHHKRAKSSINNTLPYDYDANITLTTYSNAIIKCILMDQFTTKQNNTNPNTCVKATVTNQDCNNSPPIPPAGKAKRHTIRYFWG